MKRCEVPLTPFRYVENFYIDNRNLSATSLLFQMIYFSNSNCGIRIYLLD